MKSHLLSLPDAGHWHGWAGTGTICFNMLAGRRPGVGPGLQKGFKLGVTGVARTSMSVSPILPVELYWWQSLSRQTSLQPVSSSFKLPWWRRRNSAAARKTWGD